MKFVFAVLIAVAGNASLAGSVAIDIDRQTRVYRLEQVSEHGRMAVVEFLLYDLAAVAGSLRHCLPAAYKTGKGDLYRLAEKMAYWRKPAYLDWVSGRRKSALSVLNRHAQEYYIAGANRAVDECNNGSFLKRRDEIYWRLLEEIDTHLSKPL